MKVAAHQPHYLPWLGYLAKIAEADRFVVMDDLQFEAQNFQNRNRVKINHGQVWLTVPLERGPQSERICDKRIQNQASPKEHWQRRTWETLRIHYGAAPYFGCYAPELADVYTRRWERLVDLNLHLLALHCKWLEIETPIVRASSLALEGQKTERILRMCRAVGADVYLSGRGASAGYLDVGLLERCGVAVEWQRFRHPVHPQRYGGFLSHLSALDLLFNCGPASARILRQSIADDLPLAVSA